MNTKVKNKTNLIFIHRFIKAIADSILKVFIPLLILKQGGTFIMALTYIATYYSLTIVLNLVLKKFIQKYAVISIILQTIPIILLQIVITFSITWWSMIMLGILSSFTQTLYNVPANLVITITDKNINLAGANIASKAGKLIFVLISGYVISLNLNNALIFLCLIGSTLHICSVIPIIFAYKTLGNKYEETHNNSFLLHRKEFKTFNIFHIFFGLFNAFIDMVIPIYLYLNNLEFKTITVVIAVMYGLEILSNYFANFLFKRNKAFLSVILSTICFLLGSIPMIIVKVPVVLYICSSLLSISWPLLLVPMYKTYSFKLREKNIVMDGMSYRDVYVFSGKILPFIPCFFVQDLRLAFIIGIVGLIGLFVTTKNIFKKNNNQTEGNDNE